MTEVEGGFGREWKRAGMKKKENFKNHIHWGGSPERSDA